MPRQTRTELERSLDELVDTLDAVVSSGGESTPAAAAAIRACVIFARAAGMQPEALLIALRPRLGRAVEHLPSDVREAHLRAMVSLAITSYFEADE